MSNTLRVDTFLSKMAGGGARPNLFSVKLGMAAFGVSGDDPILVKAAQLPASVIPEVTVPFRGRQIKLSGDKTFEPWTITIINDNDFKLRNAFETWSNTIQEHISGQGILRPLDYMVDMEVAQLNRREEEVKTYFFKSVWPSNVSSIDLSYDTENTVEEFTVELQVTYWDASGSVIT